MKSSTSLSSLLILGAVSSELFSTAAAAPPVAISGVKNIIIIINDGAGPTVYDATRLYLGKPLAVDGAAFRKVFMSTYPLRPDGTANNIPGSKTQDPATVYASAKFWDTTPVAGLSTVAGYSMPAGAQAGFTQIAGPLYPAGFAGYEFSRFAHPDSANTASAIASGIKSYNNAINVDGAGEAQTSIVDLIEAARVAGKNTGVVSTVQFADATPAALGGAHNVTRSDHLAIAREMFASGKLDVIGGTGNPDFDDDGKPRTPSYKWIAPELWADLKAGTNQSGANAQKWTLVQDSAAIDAMARKPSRLKKLAMIVKGDSSTQFNRTNIIKRADGTTPIDATEDRVYGTPLKATVPSQAEMTLAALNTLDQDGKGFYLMSEAGAVDRAEHANNSARMIEEMIASDDTVRAVIEWVNRRDTAATWANTLLIVTADHDHLLYGPQADTVPFQPLEDKGAGQVPGNKWLGANHGTGLVPLFAYGRGAAALTKMATKIDRNIDPSKRAFGHGVYFDQTELGAVLKATVRQRR